MGKLTPRTPDWTDTAPVNMTAVQEIRADADDVFAALADHETWPEWFSAISRVERLGDQYDGVGSQRRVHLARGLFHTDETFIEWDPGRVWSFTVCEANGPLAVLESLNERVTIEGQGADRVRVTYLMALQPPRWARAVFDKALRRGFERNLAKSLAELSRRLEQGGSSKTT